MKGDIPEASLRWVGDNALDRLTEEPPQKEQASEGRG